MADPSIADVLKAISDLREHVDLKLGTLEAKVDTVSAKVDTHRAETRKGFLDLDAELAGHVKVHNRIDARLATPAARRAPKRRAKR